MLFRSSLRSSLKSKIRSTYLLVSSSSIATCYCNFRKNIFIKIRKLEDQRQNRRKLVRTDFTIISNNCWGGIISEKYGLRKNSPTCGLLILGEDYIKFCRDIHHYIDEKLQFIPFAESRYCDMFPGQQFPVAKLDDIEIYFMHYASKELAAEKWYRRCERINWNNIVYKISERETFDGNMMREFMTLPYKNKLCFAYDDIPGAVIIPELKDLREDETNLFAERFDEAAYLNSIKRG